MIEVKVGDIAEILGRKLPEIPISCIEAYVFECLEASRPAMKIICKDMFPTLDEHSQKKTFRRPYYNL